MRVKTLAAVAILVAGMTVVAVGQYAPGQGGGRGMGQFHGVGGQITAINGDTLTLQTFRGETATVKVTSSTQIRKDGAEANLSDFKVGDRIMVAGEQDSNGVWVAKVLGQRSGQHGPGMGGQRGSGMGMGGQRPAPEDNGKTYIAGTVTRIDGTRLTVKKLDGTEQVIAVDDDTSFRNDRRESVTLADVKVGDFVRGPGALKSNVFVPSQLTAGANRPRQAPPAGSQPGVPPADVPPQSPAPPDSSNDRK